MWIGEHPYIIREAWVTIAMWSAVLVLVVALALVNWARWRR